MGPDKDPVGERILELEAALAVLQARYNALEDRYVRVDCAYRRLTSKLRKVMTEEQVMEGGKNGAIPKGENHA